MNALYENHSEKERLEKLIKGGNAIAFVGSGFSTGRIPNWDSLVKKLCHDCNSEYVFGGDVFALVAMAQKAFEKKPDKFLESLKEIFKELPHTPDPVAYQYLAQTPFKSYVTLNFDSFLLNQLNIFKKNMVEGNEEFKCIVYPDFPVSFLEKNALFHIHGLINDRRHLSVEDIVLTQSTFNEAYNSEGSKMKVFWEVLTTEHTVIFLACGLREPEIQLTLKSCTMKRKKIVENGGSPPPLYIFFESYKIEGSNEYDNEKQTAEDAELLNYGISVIRYNARDSKHSGLLDILRSWREVQPPSFYSNSDEPWNNL